MLVTHQPEWVQDSLSLVDMGSLCVSSDCDRFQEKHWFVCIVTYDPTIDKYQNILENVLQPLLPIWQEHTLESSFCSCELETGIPIPFELDPSLSCGHSGGRA